MKWCAPPSPARRAAAACSISSPRLGRHHEGEGVAADRLGRGPAEDVLGRRVPLRDHQVVAPHDVGERHPADVEAQPLVGVAQLQHALPQLGLRPLAIDVGAEHVGQRLEQRALLGEERALGGGRLLDEVGDVDEARHSAARERRRLRPRRRAPAGRPASTSPQAMRASHTSGYCQPSGSRRPVARRAGPGRTAGRTARRGRPPGAPSAPSRARRERGTAAGARSRWRPTPRRTRCDRPARRAPAPPPPRRSRACRRRSPARRCAPPGR